MSINPPATRKDIDDVLQVLDVMMSRIDERFTETEASTAKLRKDIKESLYSSTR